MFSIGAKTISLIKGTYCSLFNMNNYLLEHNIERVNYGV